MICCKCFTSMDRRDFWSLFWYKNLREKYVRSPTEPEKAETTTFVCFPVKDTRIPWLSRPWRSTEWVFVWRQSTMWLNSRPDPVNRAQECLFSPIRRPLKVRTNENIEYVKKRIAVEDPPTQTCLSHEMNCSVHSVNDIIHKDLNQRVAKENARFTP